MAHRPEEDPGIRTPPMRPLRIVGTQAASQLASRSLVSRQDSYPRRADRRSQSQLDTWKSIRGARKDASQVARGGLFDSKSCCLSKQLLSRILLRFFQPINRFLVGRLQAIDLLNVR
jgi:hypothetical protein